MRGPQANEDEKSKQTKGRKVTASQQNTGRPSLKQTEQKQTIPQPSIGSDTTTQSQIVITEDEFRALVASKAYELFERRQAVTEVEDWLEAERLIKEKLLSQRQWAGSV